MIPVGNQCRDERQPCPDAFLLSHPSPNPTVEDRKEIQNYAQSLGGSYTADLDKTCTHLIAGAPKGAKYAFATKNGIKIVSLQWFRDCVTNKARVAEEEYVLGKENARSGQVAPVSESRAREAPVGATVPRTSGFMPQQQPPAAPLATALPMKRPQPRNEEAEDGIASLLEARADGHPASYLENLQFYFSDTIPAPKRSQLRRIVRDGGGLTRDEFSGQGVTHFVLPEDGTKLGAADEAMLKSSKKLPFVIRYYWLRECLRQQALVPLTTVYAVDLPPSLAVLPGPRSSQQAGSVSAPVPSVVPASVSVPTAATASMNPLPNDARVAQVRRRLGRTSDHISESLDELMGSAPPPAAHGKPPMVPSKRKSAPDPIETKIKTEPGRVKVEPAEPPALGQGSVFRGCTILCYGLSAEHDEMVKMAIENQMGRFCTEVPRDEVVGKKFVVTLLPE